MLMKNEQALTDLSKALNIKADYHEAYFERAYAYYLLNKMDEAIQDYDRGLELDPENGPGYLNRGSVKFDMDDVDGACNDWKKAAKLGIGIAGELNKEYCASRS